MRLGVPRSIPEEDVFAYPSKRNPRVVAPDPDALGIDTSAQAEKTEEPGDSGREQVVSLRSPRLAALDEFFCATRDPLTAGRFGGEYYFALFSGWRGGGRE